MRLICYTLYPRKAENEITTAAYAGYPAAFAKLTQAAGFMIMKTNNYQNK